MPDTVGSVLDWGRRMLQMKDPQAASIEARALLSHVTGWDEVKLWTERDTHLSESEVDNFRDLILKRHHQRVPIAYLTGKVEFLSLPFSVDKGVFIPRPETEHLVSAVSELCNDMGSPVIADVGTGTGIIAVCSALACETATVWAVDVCAKACACARRNALELEVSDRVNVVHGDMFQSLIQDVRFNVIACNPPYVKTNDIETLQPDIKKHEPIHALNGGSDGLDFYRTLLAKCPDYLTARGFVVLELGADTSRGVKAFALGTGRYAIKDVIYDYAGHERVLVLQLK